MLVLATQEKLTTAEENLERAEANLETAAADNVSKLQALQVLWQDLGVLRAAVKNIHLSASARLLAPSHLWMQMPWSC